MAGDDRWVSFPALGSTATIGIASGATSGSVAVEAVVKRTVQQIDEACSRFRDDSELSALNSASGRPVRASALLLDAVSEALRAAQLTDGDVDPTVGGALIALGYDRDFAAVGGRTAPKLELVPVPGWQTVRVDRDAGTVRLARGVTLDLGATAKALAADRAAAEASAAAGCGVLVALGGDIAIAGVGPPEGWRVRVTDDHRADASAPGQWITLHSGGLASSSTTVRRWETASGSAHHLLNPSTGGSANGPWRTVSVAAATCLDANIASTAAIIRGERAVAWLESLGLPARLVSVGGHAEHLAGWPSEGDALG
ncbi:MAG: FAD:protein FMN transferase [Actinomycetota bacterium]|nr:FAD:protein FMN transferase [Actinomycetota bacterium]